MGCSNEQTIINNREKYLDELEKYQIILIIKTPCSSVESSLYKKICKEFNYHYLSTGDILKKIFLEEKKDIESLKTIEDIKKSILIPSNEVIEILKNEIFKINNNKKMFVDGFPRNLENMEMWKNVMNGVTILKKIIYIKINKEEILKRIKEKNEIENFQNSQKYDNQLNIFNDNIVPLIEEIKKEDNLLEIDGMKNEEDIYKNLYQSIIKYKLF